MIKTKIYQYQTMQCKLGLLSSPPSHSIFPLVLALCQGLHLFLIKSEEAAGITLWSRDQDAFAGKLA